MESSSEHAHQFEINSDDCMLLMARQEIGRLVSAEPQPEVRPVNFVLVGRRLFIRTDAPVSDDIEVAFEVDQIDVADQQGWSVVARGRAHPIAEAAVPDRVMTRLQPWAPGPKTAWTVIDIDTVTGRWVQGERATETPDLRGYL